jgi:guanylate kinase
MPTLLNRRGLMFVLSSPSGAGKTTLSHRLMEAEKDIEMSVSVTTRVPRHGENDHVDYHFISKPEFQRRAAANELLEWAEVFGNDYGTPRQPVEAALAGGRDVLFDIDWQGTRQLKSSSAPDLVTVFILPPSAAALRDRLMKRATDSADVVGARMAKAASEISHWDEYDYIIVNDDLDASLAAIRAILQAERLKRQRRLKGLTGLVERLDAQLAKMSAKP